MRSLSRPALCGLLGGLLGAACLPPSSEEWVADHAQTWGIEIRVVADGEFAPGLSARVGHHRADVLPHDGVELQWYGAGPEGVTLRPPIWVVAPTTGELNILSVVKGELPACPDPLPFSAPLCRFGVGERVRVNLGDASSLRWREVVHYQPLRVLAIASDGDVIEPETCLHRMLSERIPDLAGCLLASRSVGVGPEGHLWTYIGAPPGVQDVPPEVSSAGANVNPVIEQFELVRTIDGDERTTVVEDGATIMVRERERLTLRLRLEAEAAEKYTYWYLSEPMNEFVISEREELLDIVGRFSAQADDYSATADGLEHSWTVADTTRLYLQIGDDRGGRAFASLHFVLDGDP